jgi:hypothetical protein
LQFACKLAVLALQLLPFGTDRGLPARIQLILTLQTLFMQA